MRNCNLLSDWEPMNVKTNPNLLSAQAGANTWDDGGAMPAALRWKSDASFWRSLSLRFLTGFSIVIIASAMAWPFLPRRYEATATIILHPRDPESSSDTPQFMRQPLDESAMQSEIDRIASPTLAATVVAKHSLSADPEFNRGWTSWFSKSAPSDAALRQRLLAHLSVSRDRHSYTVKFGFESSDPVKAAALTDTLLKAYLAAQLERERQTINDLTDWLVEQVSLLRAKSDASQQAVRDFLVESGLIDTGAKISLEHQLATLSTEAALTKSRTADAQARANALSDLQKAGKLDGAPEVVASPVIQILKEKMAGGRSTVSPVEAPQNAIEAQIAAEADHIIQSAKTEARASSEREAALQSAIKIIRDEMIKMQKSELRLAILRRDADADRTALDNALVRLAGQTARAKAVVPHVDIMASPEVPIRPVSPNPFLAVLGSLMAACLAGAAMVWRPLLGWIRRITAH
jgi:polysaccharide biosynthesis transport protein